MADPQILISLAELIVRSTSKYIAIRQREYQSEQLRELVIRQDCGFSELRGTLSDARARIEGLAGKDLHRAIESLRKYLGAETPEMKKKLLDQAHSDFMGAEAVERDPLRRATALLGLVACEIRCDENGLATNTCNKFLKEHKRNLNNTTVIRQLESASRLEAYRALGPAVIQLKQSISPQRRLPEKGKQKTGMEKWVGFGLWLALGWALVIFAMQRAPSRVVPVLSNSNLQDTINTYLREVKKLGKDAAVTDVKKWPSPGDNEAIAEFEYRENDRNVSREWVFEIGSDGHVVGSRSRQK